MRMVENTFFINRRGLLRLIDQPMLHIKYGNKTINKQKAKGTHRIHEAQ